MDEGRRGGREEWRSGGGQEWTRGGVEEGRRHGCAPILLLLARRRLQRERAGRVERRRLGALLGAARDGGRLLPRVLRGRSGTSHGRVVDMSCARLLPRVLRRTAEPRQGSAEARQSSISAHLDLSPLLDTPLSAHLGRVVTSDGGSMSDADEASEKSSYRKAPREGSWTVPGGVRGEREVVPRRSTRRRNAPSQSCTFFITHNSFIRGGGARLRLCKSEHTLLFSLPFDIPRCCAADESSARGPCAFFPPGLVLGLLAYQLHPDR